MAEYIFNLRTFQRMICFSGYKQRSESGCVSLLQDSETAELYGCRAGFVRRFFEICIPRAADCVETDCAGADCAEMAYSQHLNRVLGLGCFQFCAEQNRFENGRFAVYGCVLGCYASVLRAFQQGRFAAACGYQC